MEEIILDEAYRTITVMDGERNVTIPMAQAIIRSLAVNAAKRQQRAQRLFAELLSATERPNAELQVRFPEAALDDRIAWEKELVRRDYLGITDLPPPLPHPDHVIVDVRKGTVRTAGPATKAEKAEWDAILAAKAVIEDSAAQLRAANETETDADEVADNLRFIAIGENKTRTDWESRARVRTRRRGCANSAAPSLTEPSSSSALSLGRTLIAGGRRIPWQVRRSRYRGEIPCKCRTRVVTPRLRA